MNKNNKIFIYISIVIIIALLVVGVTYAYWTWGTVRSNESNIALTVSGSSGDLYARINGGEAISNEDVTLLPTSICMSSGTLQRTVSVTYKNGTNKVALVEAQLDLTELSGLACSTNLTDTELSHMHWAITTNSSSCSDDVVSFGTFEYMEFSCSNNVKTISNMINHSLYGNIFPLFNYRYTEDNEEYTVWSLPMISIAANPNMVSEVTTPYYVYIWIDEDYTHTNYGDVNDDPLSDLNFKLEWHAKIDQNLVCGDTTGDGTVTEDDAALVLYEFAFNSQFQSARTNLLGDVNSNGQVQTSDSTIIRKYVTGENVVLNCPID